MTMSLKLRSYTELQRLSTFLERYGYLRLAGFVGDVTFGYDRYLNQKFYTSRRWMEIRDRVILRDNGCDLGVSGYDIYGMITVHHMNPITVEDIENESDNLFDPEFLICTTHKTHLAIHYGDESILPEIPIDRYPGNKT